MYEYKVISKWAGWGGGWGSESDIADMANALAVEGWRLVRSEADGFRWFWIFPRRKVLLFFEREVRAVARAAEPAGTNVSAREPARETPFVRR